MGSGLWGSSSLESLQEDYSNSVYALRKWNRQTFGYIQDYISLVKGVLGRVQFGDPTDMNLGREGNLLMELDEPLKREEVMTVLWKQPFYRQVV